MVLSDEDRARIEEEERYRAEARIRAEEEVRRRIASESQRPEVVVTAKTKTASKGGGCGCLTAIVVGIVFLAVLGGQEKRQASPSREGQVTTPAPVSAVSLSPEERAAAEKKAAEEAEAARKKAAEDAQTVEEDRQQRMNLRWWYSEDADDMGRGTVRTAYVKSITQVEFHFPYSGSQRATLLLRVHPKYGKDVIFRIEKGQFSCGIDNCRVSVVFGDGKPMSFSASEAADHSTEVLFLEDYDRFVSNLRKVSRVRIEAQFFQEGDRTFEFNVKNLQWK